MHFRDTPDSLSGLEIPGNIWFRRFAVSHTLAVHECSSTPENIDYFLHVKIDKHVYTSGFNSRDPVSILVRGVSRYI